MWASEASKGPVTKPGFLSPLRLQHLMSPKVPPHKLGLLLKTVRANLFRFCVLRKSEQRAIRRRETAAASRCWSCRQRKMTDARSTMLSSTFFTAEPSWVKWSVLALASRQGFLFVCLFCLFWRVNGAADGLASCTDRRLLGCFFLRSVSRQVTERILTVHLPLPFFFSALISALSLSSFQANFFLCLVIRFHLSWCAFGQILLDSFPFSCLELCRNIFPVIDRRLQGKLQHQPRWTLIYYWK